MSYIMDKVKDLEFCVWKESKNKTASVPIKTGEK